VIGGPALYRIEAYLDEAPEGVVVANRASVGAGEKSRALLITSYRRIDTGDPWILARDIGAFKPDFILQGPRAQVARILDAPPRSRVSGTFRHVRGLHTLIIDPHDLTLEPARGTRE
jgi:hypothetical protein